jgi:hypothetical protein
MIGNEVAEVLMKKNPWLPILVLVFTAFAIVDGASALSAPQEAAGDVKLARILEQTKAYCLKLEKAALDFTCVEKIEEKTYILPEILPDTFVSNPSQAARVTGYSYPSLRKPYSYHYVYDYQFVRKGGLKTERRTLIEENGRKKKEEDARLTTLSIRVENALFGPIGLLGAEWQPHHEYKIIGEETQKGRKFIIIEAVPKPSLNRPHCFGRIWVQEDDARIAKISWDQTSVGNFLKVQATAERLKAEPRLSSVTEYGLEKNGVHFPSKDTTEEAYLLKNGKKFVRSLTTILYKDYKFFTVETEVAY